MCHTGRNIFATRKSPASADKDVWTIREAVKRDSLLKSIFAWSVLFSWQLAGAEQRADLPDLTNLSFEDLSGVRLSTVSRHLTDPRKVPAVVITIDSDEIIRQG